MCRHSTRQRRSCEPRLHVYLSAALHMHCFLTLCVARFHALRCGAVLELLERTGFQPRDIDILITASSIYCGTPSQASMIINRFK